MCPGPESNRHPAFTGTDFKSAASTYSATRAQKKQLLNMGYDSLKGKKKKKVEIQPLKIHPSYRNQMVLSCSIFSTAL